MSTLRPTPSRRPWQRVPRWSVVAAAVVVGLGLIGGGLLLTSSDDDTAPAAAPACTPTPAATTPPEDVEINVYNATERFGLAGSVAEDLESRGFLIDAIDNDPQDAEIEGTAVVRYVGANREAARWAAAQVPDARIAKVTGPREGARVDVVVGEGFLELADPEAALAAYTASAPEPTC